MATTVSVGISIWPATACAAAAPRRHLLRDRDLHHALVPPTLLFLPLSQVVVWLGVADSIFGLMLIYPTFLRPARLLMGYFGPSRREIEECALVDGATRMQTL